MSTVRDKGGAAAAVLPLLLLLAALLGFDSTPAAADEASVLKESGIRFPDGFDANTVGELKGEASGLQATPGGNGPVRFRLDAGGERYTVLAAPPWHWQALGAGLTDGTQVVVRGSKTLGRDMNLYVIAQEIRVPAAGATYTLRDEDGRPLWTGKVRGAGAGHRGGAGSGSAIGMPSGGASGSGGGAGFRRGGPAGSGAGRRR